MRKLEIVERCAPDDSAHASRRNWMDPELVDSDDGGVAAFLIAHLHPLACPP